MQSSTNSVSSAPADPFPAAAPPPEMLSLPDSTVSGQCLYNSQVSSPPCDTQLPSPLLPLAHSSLNPVTLAGWDPPPAPPSLPCTPILRAAHLPGHRSAQAETILARCGCSLHGLLDAASLSSPLGSLAAIDGHFHSVRPSPLFWFIHVICYYNALPYLKTKDP